MSSILHSRRLLPSSTKLTRVLKGYASLRIDRHCRCLSSNVAGQPSLQCVQTYGIPHSGRRSISGPSHKYKDDGEKRRWGSIVLTTLGVSAFVGAAFCFNWYTNREPNYESLRKEAQLRLEKASDFELSDLQSVTRSNLSTWKESAEPKIPMEMKPCNTESDRTSSPDTSITNNVPATTDEAQKPPLLSTDEDEGPPLTYIDPTKVQFPSHIPYLIIGAGTAGLSAARAIRASDALSKILMIAGGTGPGDGAEPGIKETDFQEPPPYLRPPLSKELWRRSKKRQEKVLQTSGDIRRHSWLYYEAESFFLKPEFLPAVEYGGVALLRGDPVVRLDPDTHTATLASGRVITYDRCLLATGGRPKRVQHLELCSSTHKDLMEAGLVSYFRTLADYKRLRELTDQYRGSGGKMAVIGGGFLGSELTVSLLTEASAKSAKTDQSTKEAPNKSSQSSKSKLSVLHIFRESSPMGHILPPCLASATGRFESSMGAELWSSSEIVSISLVPDHAPSPVSMESKTDGKIPFSSLQMVSASEGSQRRVRLRIRRSGLGGDKVEEVDVDHVVIAAGIEANTHLAESAGLEVDPVNGGFLVNAELEARAGIFAAGDAASYWDPVLGFRRRVEHLNFAEETGALAGKNMANFTPQQPGTTGQTYEPIRYQYQSSLWSSLGPDLSWDAIGHVDSRQLLTRSFFVSEETLSSKNTTGDAKSPTSQSFPQAEFGRLARGVVFYLTPKEKRLVGVLLWNLPEDLYSDKEYAAPSRLNVARGLLAKRLCIGRNSDESEEQELRRLASLFDLTGELEDDYAELKAYTEAKKQELLNAESAKNEPPSEPENRPSQRSRT